MSVSLGANQYGKAENRVVRIYRDSARHEIVDLNVSTSLRGDFTAAHIAGDQADVLPTDTQKNTAFAYAKEHGVTSPEDYAIALGRHFLDAAAKVDSAQIRVEQYAWDRIPAGPNGHDHAFVQRGGAVRTAVVTVAGRGAGQKIHVLSGLRDLVLLKSTGSEFKGFLKDRYTTLTETDDRILATSLIARWRHTVAGGIDWNKSYDTIKATLLDAFAGTYSRALQETLYVMGRQALETDEQVAEIRFSAPNKHHFLVDLSPFGVANDGEVFIAADRPYGLIEATVTRDGAAPAEDAWANVPAFI
ncbi:MAG TPA: urate oxidase [Pseudonocardiaceae bacterium]|jgi:urate oxidase|nr:urate oxidase [Pseudonocardiaceae bacterium]